VLIGVIEEMNKESTRTIQLNEFQTGHYIKYDILFNQYIWWCCIMHTALSINRKNVWSYVQNHPCGTVGVKIAMCSGSLCTAR